MLFATAVLVAALVLMLIGFAALKRRSRAADSGWPVFATPVLSQAEQIMFHRLVKVFPEYLVLPQVSLAQFINVRKGANFYSVFNRYNRLTADFVICQRDFKVLSVMELDDRSHDRPKRLDADRRKSEVLRAAGIPLHRLNVNPMPGEVELRELLAG
jgi:hypothetical protein